MINLKTYVAPAFILLAITASAANDIANFGRYENDNKRIMELPNTGSRVVFMGNRLPDGIYVAGTESLTQKIVIKN